MHKTEGLVKTNKYKIQRYRNEAKRKEQQKVIQIQKAIERELQQ